MTTSRHWHSTSTATRVWINGSTIPRRSAEKCGLRPWVWRKELGLTLCFAGCVQHLEVTTSVGKAGEAQETTVLRPIVNEACCLGLSFECRVTTASSTMFRSSVLYIVLDRTKIKIVYSSSLPCLELDLASCFWPAYIFLSTAKESGNNSFKFVLDMRIVLLTSTRTPTRRRARTNDESCIIY